jgi:hypothetical protein
MSDASRRKILENAPKPQEPNRPVSSLGFMTAATRRGSIEVDPSENLVKPSTEFQGFIPEPPEDVKRVDSSQWQSSSREKWTYEIDLNEEKQKIEDEAPATAVEDVESPGDKAKRINMSKKDYQQLKKRAKSLKYKTSTSEFAMWEPAVQRVEAPVEINVQKNLYIPPSVSVSNFAKMLRVPLCIPLLTFTDLATLQKKMELLGLEPEQCEFDHGIVFKRYC